MWFTEEKIQNCNYFVELNQKQQICLESHIIIRPWQGHDKKYTCTIVSVAWYARPIISIDAFSGNRWELNTLFIWLIHKSMALLADVNSSEQRESNAYK